MRDVSVVFSCNPLPDGTYAVSSSGDQAAKVLAPDDILDYLGACARPPLVAVWSHDLRRSLFLVDAAAGGRTHLTVTHHGFDSAVPLVEADLDVLLSFVRSPRKAARGLVADMADWAGVPYWVMWDYLAVGATSVGRRDRVGWECDMAVPIVHAGQHSGGAFDGWSTQSASIKLADRAKRVAERLYRVAGVTEADWPER